MSEQITILAEDLPIIHGIELTPEERKEFDYLEPEELDSSQFFRYESEPHGLHNFMRMEQSQEWDGHYGLNCFCALLVKLSPCGESVKLGRATS